MYTVLVDYILIHYGFQGEAHTPTLTLQAEGAGEFTHLPAHMINGTVRLATDTRRCTGWHDLATAKSSPCPHGTVTDGSYEQCRNCMQKTGFNPAFYNASSVSPQQQARNRQPHILYLAHFAPGVVKVGISWAERGIRRLLEQGARSAVIIDTFPTADAARVCEAAIAAQPDFHETLQIRHKIKYLGEPYSKESAANELTAATTRVCDILNRQVVLNILHLDPYYTTVPVHQPIDVTKQQQISGRCVGMIGGLLLCEQDAQLFLLSLSGFKGNRLTISDQIAKNQHDPIQVSLF